MTEPSLTAQSTSAKKFLIISAGITAGITFAIITVAVAVFWYSSRPIKPGPWDRTAITAEYTALSLKASDPLVCTFRYSVENHTERDYDLPTQASIYKILAEGKGLEHDETLRWGSGTSLPAGQKINIAIQIEYQYSGNEADRNDSAKLTEFMNRRLAEIDGFAALDEANRYEIRFPKPPDAKP